MIATRECAGSFDTATAVAVTPAGSVVVAGNTDHGFDGIGTLAFSMQDVLLEPYGGQILDLTVSATTVLTATLAAERATPVYVAAAQARRYQIALGFVFGVVGLAFTALGTFAPNLLHF